MKGVYTTSLKKEQRASGAYSGRKNSGGRSRDPVLTARGPARVLAVAERLLRTEGIGAVSTRRIAGELGVTPMALYRHFRGKDALVNALVAVGFARWEILLAEAVRAPTPLGQIKAALRAYREFALAEPRFFELMFLVPRPEVPRAPDSLRATTSPAFSAVIAAVKACTRSRALRAADAEQVPLALWALAHGLIALHFSGRFGSDEGIFRRTYDRTTTLLLSELCGGGRS
jgi:AcrR family transcriptional regulator